MKCRPIEALTQRACSTVTRTGSSVSSNPSEKCEHQEVLPSTQYRWEMFEQEEIPEDSKRQTLHFLWTNGIHMDEVK